MSDDLFSSGSWLPGSFTKNFSWGEGRGLIRLHENIRVGFGEQLEPVEREVYRSRVAHLNRPDFIPLNFFLFNYVDNGVSMVAVDELVFQAIKSSHSRRFDRLALFALNFSIVGIFKGAQKHQRYPALWARHYIIDRVAQVYDWDTSRISAAEIEGYLRSQPEFQAATYTKVSTNLNFLYHLGGIESYKEKRIERWWVDALFLALDRIVADRKIDGKQTPSEMLPELLIRSGFRELTGVVTPEKTFAMAHLLSLYSVCGGPKRFEPESVKEMIAVKLPQYGWQIPNDDRPPGALHPTNPRILKTIPRNCAQLAELIGFKIVLADELDTFDPNEFVRRRAAEASQSLLNDGIAPVMSAEELHKITRGE